MNALEICRGEIAPFLREPLVSLEQWERVARRGLQLPSMVSAFYLECRLSPPGPELDLLACLRWSPEGPQLALAPDEADPARVFVSRWLQGAAATSSPSIWVELDDGGPARASPLANLHVCLDPDYFTQPSALRPSHTVRLDGSNGLQAEGARRSAVERITTELVRARLLEQSQLRQLEHAVARLPPGGRLVHVSAMAARLPNELKLYLALPAEALLPFLTSVLEHEWHTRLDAFTPWLDAKLQGSTVYCDLTFRGSICKSVGLVYSQPQIPEVAGDASRRTVRERLVREGLCTLAQDAALEAWTREPLSRRARESTDHTICRWLDLKVTLGPTRLSSKAYLGFAAASLLR